jgi:hypothetical protein
MALSMNLTIIITFIILATMMLIIHHLYVEKERFYQGANFEYATGQWVKPPRHTYIARFDQLRVYTGWMTWSFSLRIDAPTGNWRNVFRISESYHLEWNGNGNPAAMGYDWHQDYFRRPAIFIVPGQYAIHICHGSAWDSNNAFNIGVPSTSHITLVWRPNNNYSWSWWSWWYPQCDVYVNGNLVATHTYPGYLIQPDQDALLYTADRFYGADNFAVKNFKIFPMPMNGDQVRNLYNQTR